MRLFFIYYLICTSLFDSVYNVINYLVTALNENIILPVHFKKFGFVNVNLLFKENLFDFARIYSKLIRESKFYEYLTDITLFDAGNS
jgi:hypothetical protein